MPFSPHILIIEDSETDAHHIKSCLVEAGFTEVHWVSSFDGFYEAISKETWELIICDYYLGDFTALEILKILHDHGLFTSIIVASNYVTEEMAAKVMGQGARACIPKAESQALVEAALKETRRVRKELAVKARLLNCVRNAVIATAKDDKVIVWNAHAERMFGWTEVEMRDKNPYAVLWQKGAEAFADQVRPSLERDSHWEGEVIAVKKSGATIPVYWHISKIFDEKSKEFGLAGVSFDLTEKKHLEEQLLQSQKLDSIGKLAGGIAHDFNNLLTVINGYSSLLLEENITKAELQDGASQIIIAAESAARLTSQLLIFSRKQEFLMETVSINSIIADTTKMLRRLIPENIPLHIQMAEELPLIQGDVGMLYQVLMNLVVNARDAMPEGGRIDISTFQTNIANPAGAEHINQPVVALKVQDTGNGIPPEIINRIFEPFFTTKDIGKGTGLGLSTVYGIVKKHGGWITVKSDLGAGSDFTVYFPVSQSSKAAEQQVKKTAQFNSMRKAKILVVEDQLEVRGLIDRILSKNGYEVKVSPSPLEALETLENSGYGFDLVLTDIIMPGALTGPDLASRIRAKSNIGIVFMTGYSSEIAGATESLGQNETVLRKPFTVDLLLTTIHNSLSR